MDCTACTQETKQMTGAVHAGTPRAGRRDSPRSERVSSQHAVPTDGENVITYSDEFGRFPTLPFESTYCDDHYGTVHCVSPNRHLVDFLLHLRHFPARWRGSAAVSVMTLRLYIIYENIYY
ncbi:hypothetical protein EVAR_82169_1 [Eumeta japonica]|uniref:Uncharacterized protein n=1 Tax=Eumeta variegata TaxID=151549 RepID=A0A4C1U2K6_EUMVA|nr:hypothetical protein EVAR_82169_1 [Eumeta japonica]